jgi:hypothetical protein
MVHRLQQGAIAKRIQGAKDRYVSTGTRLPAVINSIKHPKIKFPHILWIGGEPPVAPSISEHSRNAGFKKRPYSSLYSDDSSALETSEKEPDGAVLMGSSMQPDVPVVSRSCLNSKVFTDAFKERVSCYSQAPTHQMGDTHHWQ